MFELQPSVKYQIIQLHEDGRSVKDIKWMTNATEKIIDEVIEEERQRKLDPVYSVIVDDGENGPYSPVPLDTGSMPVQDDASQINFNITAPVLRQPVVPPPDSPHPYGDVLTTAWLQTAESSPIRQIRTAGRQVRKAVEKLIEVEKSCAVEQRALRQKQDKIEKFKRDMARHNKALDDIKAELKALGVASRKRPYKPPTHAQLESIARARAAKGNKNAD